MKRWTEHEIMEELRELGRLAGTGAPAELIVYNTGGTYAPATVYATGPGEIGRGDTIGEALTKARAKIEAR